MPRTLAPLTSDDAPSILWPAFNELQRDPELGFAEWKVFMHCAFKPLLTPEEPREIKAVALAAQMRMSRRRVSEALDWLVEHRYMIEHSRSGRGVRSLMLAWRTKDLAPREPAKRVMTTLDRLRSKASSGRRRLRPTANGDFSRGELDAQYLAQNGKCYYCGAELGGDYHVDHKTPLVRGGSNRIDNICCACPSCNLRKNLKTEAEFRAVLATKPMVA